jgi:hypothetical protein
MHRTEYVTAQELGRKLGCDPRTAVKALTPVAKVRFGRDKTVLLYKIEQD